MTQENERGAAPLAALDRGQERVTQALDQLRAMDLVVRQRLNDLQAEAAPTAQIVGDLGLFTKVAKAAAEGIEILEQERAKREGVRLGLDLDLAAARDEIALRLACLRSAGGGGDGSERAE